MEPDLHVLSSPSAGVQRTHVRADGLGSGSSPRGGEPVPGRGENTRRTHRKQNLMFQMLSSLSTSFSSLRH